MPTYEKYSRPFPPATVDMGHADCPAIWDDGVTVCGVTVPWFCTRDVGHDGLHEADSLDDGVAARWGDDEQPTEDTRQR